jgi:hypothetical protein
MGGSVVQDSANSITRGVWHAIKRFPGTGRKSRPCKQHERESNPTDQGRDAAGAIAGFVRRIRGGSHEVRNIKQQVRRTIHQDSVMIDHAIHLPDL